MISSTIRATINCDIQKVWAAVTNINNYPLWRSDISGVEVVDDGQFVEFSKSGFATEFIVTCCKPCEHWEFDILNGNINGHWTGLFSKVDGGTGIVFTEIVDTKKFIFKPFIKHYIKSQQKKFVNDLIKYLGKK